MLKSLKLVNFRSFKSFTLTFGNGAYLVGPNNAGKTTILTALRTADVLLRYAHARNPNRRVEDDGAFRPAYPATLREFPSLRESVRYEFRNLEARIELTWKSGARLTVVWPEDDGDEAIEPFFYLEHLPGMYVTSVKQARTSFPLLGVVPILSPIEAAEPLLEEKYVRQHLSGRLSSRHFRNQLRMLKIAGELERFLEWSREWLSEITVDTVDSHLGEKVTELDVYYSEARSRVQKELAWAGDGFQIWLQILYHLYRVRDATTVILDEPEVYLHPDLQRRLVQLLESEGKQVVLATHSAELVSEADARSIVLVDKEARRGKRVRAESDLQTLSDLLGTAFNVRLARALKSRVVVFVEGKDMGVLRKLAATIGCDAVARERGITVIALNGYSRWGEVGPFKWLCQELLPEALEVFVILDRDYRPDSVVTAVEREFVAAAVPAHIWARKELESYVITPSVISRETGIAEGVVSSMLGDITSTMGNEVFGQLLGERTAAERSGSNHANSIAIAFKGEFDANWPDPEYRLRVCPPKRIISALNAKLQAEGHKTVSAVALAKAHKVEEVDAELANVLRSIEASVGDDALVGGAASP